MAAVQSGDKAFYLAPCQKILAVRKKSLANDSDCLTPCDVMVGMKDCKPAKPDHHLWNNNGTFWCHYTVHESDYTKRRVRVSLHTKDQREARARRDALLKSVPNASVRFTPGLSLAFSFNDLPVRREHALSVYDAGFSSRAEMN
jgi:hypothetical protein